MGLGIMERWILAGVGSVAVMVVWVLPLQAATVAATVEAAIIQTISSTTRNGLGFGDISANSVPGTVVMTSSGTRTTTGGVTINSATAATPAAFDLEGMANASYAISLPTSVVLDDGAGSSMIVDGFTSSPVDAGVLDSSGRQTLYVGASLNVGSNQPYGSYSGLMAVTVEYN